jgi:hypothetical protein
MSGRHYDLTDRAATPPTVNTAAAFGTDYLHSVTDASIEQSESILYTNMGNVMRKLPTRLRTRKQLLRNAGTRLIREQLFPLRSIRRSVRGRHLISWKYNHKIAPIGSTNGAAPQTSLTDTRAILINRARG